MTFIINKLFRDKLVPEQIAMGRTVSYITLSGQQLFDVLYNKADEELIELKNLLHTEKNNIRKSLSDLKEELIKELKDLQEVIDTLIHYEQNTPKTKEFQRTVDEICEKFEITKNEVMYAQQTDREERGSFREGQYVETLDIPENDPWYQYFEKKYPQAK